MRLLGYFVIVKGSVSLNYVKSFKFLQNYTSMLVPEKLFELFPLISEEPQ